MMSAYFGDLLKPGCAWLWKGKRLPIVFSGSEFEELASPTKQQLRIDVATLQSCRTFLL